MNNYKEIYSKISNKELIEILENEENYNPKAIIEAKKQSKI